MFQSTFVSVLDAGTSAALQVELVRFAGHLGFEIGAAVTVVDNPLGATKFIDIGNTPQAYLSAYMDPRVSKADPVMQHCRERSTPIVWDQSTYVKADRAEKWEHQASHGYRCGIAVAMHMPKGIHFMFGVDGSRPLPRCSARLSRMTAELQLFAVHAQEAMARLLFRSVSSGVELGLTKRELECLRWTMEGKTAWELGRILGIAEQTAVRHLHNASRKLDCVNK
ncbi:MAG TPA: LuxR family transcriptional regulator, partial [Rhizobacter sp.]|nr:LuxR family transcriptional regulator [Rhizobacter sp.]